MFNLDNLQKFFYATCYQLTHDMYAVCLLYAYRVCTCLEKPWILGVWFQGLESTWLFIERDRKMPMLLRFQVNESQQMFTKQSIIFSKCLIKKKKCENFVLAGAFLLLLSMYMHVELRWSWFEVNFHQKKFLKFQSTVA